ncbi:MAG: tetratricopeptide repeat protein [Acidobacteriota bacterium]
MERHVLSREGNAAELFSGSLLARPRFFMIKRRISFYLLACGLGALLGSASYTAENSGHLASGRNAVGFKLIVAADPTRSYPAAAGTSVQDRPMRVYLWYPAVPDQGKPLTIGDFVRWAGEDFGETTRGRPAGEPALPVPLKRGLEAEDIGPLLARPLRSHLGPSAASGEFPLLVFGQGLYYESPLSNAVLCEYLASRGFIVATCPLVGTRYRLTNLNAEDLETQVRDLEFVLAEARAAFPGRTARLGVVGYDLGGMAGLLLAMHRPEIAAFLSIDSGIHIPHPSGLPGAHPSYREECFTIPWMHVTQARFLEAARTEKPEATLSGRRKYGDSWMVGLPTVNHGGFTSYATFGIRNPVRGYWEGFGDEARNVHDAMCRLAGDFFEATLKDAPAALSLWTCGTDAAGRGGLEVEFLRGAAAPESSRSLLRRIMEAGLDAVRPDIDRIRAANPGAEILNGQELRWLAYHFLLWWGREKEALDAFQLNVELHPKSAEAWAGLGEACLLSGENEEAITSFRKALELNPDLPNVKAALEALTKK